MLILFPEIKPYKRHHLKVDSVHTLYIEESGNEDGIPVLFLHGGPGAGTQSSHRRFFDPEKYRIILFDQRGCGGSLPHASLDDNNTPALVADIEKIRNHLGVDCWALCGGSWGSTLALVYAQAFPERVKGMVLRGIFLARQKDLDWLYLDGANRVFPDAWDDFVRPIPKGERGNLIEAFNKRLTGKDELSRMAAAKAWSCWEAQCATLRPSHLLMDHYGEPRTALSMARIAAHYFVNHSFLEPNQILGAMDKISHIPGIIIHGRYDMVCPLENAMELSRLWENAGLNIIREAGHSSREPGIEDALVRATDEMAAILGFSH